MRLIIYTLALVLLPMLAQANHIERQVEGFWENPSTHTTIKINAKRYGFSVKGLYGQRRNTRFMRNRRGQYIDSRGNELRIRSRSRIIFHNRHNGLQTRFIRQVNYDAGDRYNNPYATEHYDHYSDRYYRDNNQNRVNDRYSGSGYYRGDNDLRDRRTESTESHKNKLSFTPSRIDDDRLRNIEGTWLSQGANSKKVIIVSTRDGIKVKDTSNDKWHRYKLSSDLKSLVDEKGNLYQVDGKSLYWIAKSGNTVLQLEKKSDRTFYTD